MALAEVFEAFAGPEAPVEFTAYDGSATGPEDAPFALHLRSPRGAAYLATSPGSLGCWI